MSEMSKQLTVPARLVSWAEPFLSFLKGWQDTVALTLRTTDCRVDDRAVGDPQNGRDLPVAPDDAVASRRTNSCALGVPDAPHRRHTEVDEMRRNQQTPSIRRSTADRGKYFTPIPHVPLSSPHLPRKATSPTLPEHPQCKPNCKSEEEQCNETAATCPSRPSP